MSDQNKRGTPYAVLGNELKKLRENSRESLAEVSGAVEIDVADLSLIEEGQFRPAEDILLLLMTHFAISDDQATRLWQMAGYDQQPTNTVVVTTDNQTLVQSNGQIVYTDMVHVMANNYGVIMNFMQSSGPGNQPIAVARVGMSKEHARSVLEVLKQTLDQSEPKHLSSSKKHKDNRKQK